MIENNIFFIWLGDVVPNYALFAVDAFKMANQSFNIQLVHKTTADIEHPIVENEVDQCFLDSIRTAIGKYEVPLHYQEYIDNQRRLYGKDIRFVQLLSDIFRVQLVNSLGGIYLDCDTFPNRPFDNQLLEDDFCVARHYSKTFVSQDNYFFGCKKKSSIDDFLIPLPYKCFGKQKYRLICQTIPSIQANVKFIYQKSLFYRQQLQYKPNLFNDSFYINHYSRENWRNSIHRIPMCKYDFPVE